ncbi:ATP-binding protein [Cryobacterium sp. TMT2-10]|uniref:ATP-binding protein n=1 Tax=Cryobacterium sp. TMT2-10 TaxID=1259244 RepID=UPI0021025536|nr:ATP-binding protein [Cryobacterium sp. TMT2-10]
MLAELGTCRYLETATNVLLIGPPGVGKTHIATGLGHAAVQAGYRTYFTSAADLAARCHRAAIEGKWGTMMRFFAGPTLLVIDLCRLRDYADVGGAAGPAPSVFQDCDR